MMTFQSHSTILIETYMYLTDTIYPPLPRVILRLNVANQ
jgi:hypothetical protein